MSNKSGISSQVIFLSKRGGVLHGIAEKFAPDLPAGTGNFTVPIASCLAASASSPNCASSTPPEAAMAVRDGLGV